MAGTIQAHGTVTTDGTLQTISGASYTSTVTYQLTLNCNAMAAGDKIDLYITEKGDTGDTEAQFGQWTIDGNIVAQTNADKVYTTPPVLSPYSITFKIKRTAGTDRAYTYSITSP